MVPDSISSTNLTRGYLKDVSNVVMGGLLLVRTRFENADRGSLIGGNFQEVMSHRREYVTFEQRLWTVSSIELTK